MPQVEPGKQMEKEREREHCKLYWGKRVSLCSFSFSLSKNGTLGKILSLSFIGQVVFNWREAYRCFKKCLFFCITWILALGKSTGVPNTNFTSALISFNITGSLSTSKAFSSFFFTPDLDDGFIRGKWRGFFLKKHYIIFWLYCHLTGSFKIFAIHLRVLCITFPSCFYPQISLYSILKLRDADCPKIIL